MAAQDRRIRKPRIPQSHRLVVIDGDSKFTEYLSAMLSVAGVVVDAFQSGEEFTAREASEGEVCILLDLRLSGMTGAQLARAMGSKGFSKPIIIGMGPLETGTTTESPLPPDVHALVRKPFDSADVTALIEAIQAAMRQRTLESARLGPLPSTSRDAGGVFLERFQTLTRREREIARLVAEGLSSKVIAQTLSLSTRTVENHRAHILKKLDVGNAAQIARALSNLPIE